MKKDKNDNQAVIPILSMNKVINFMARRYGEEDAHQFKIYLRNHGYISNISLFDLMFERLMYLLESERGDSK